MLRINKYLADKDIASRREADRLIQAGSVFINGRVAELGDLVSETDKVEVRNMRLSHAYFAYNKPRGIVSSTPTKTETDIITHTKFPMVVFPIGRLDKDSTGLIIMTDDGRLTKKLLDPKFEHEKEYEVEVDEPVTAEFLKDMASGVTITTNTKEQHLTKPAKLKKIGPNTFSIILTEGKNRQIRRMCEELGYEVKNLKRVRIGNILLGKLKEGAFIPVTENEILKNSK
jgi:23S rRNA pseudouridine2604 synthase